MNMARPTPSYRGKRRPVAKPDPATRLRLVQRAIALLKTSRRFLKQADAPAALGKVRAALKSAEGAERHASLAPYREERQRKAREMREYHAARRDEESQDRERVVIEIQKEA
jgi:hypothetical protein